MRSSVVLPQPLGPSTETKLNSGKSTLMSLSASTPGEPFLGEQVGLGLQKPLADILHPDLGATSAAGCASSRARSGWTFKPCPTANGSWKIPIAAGRLRHCFRTCQGQLRCLSERGYRPAGGFDFADSADLSRSMALLGERSTRLHHLFEFVARNRA